MNTKTKYTLVLLAALALPLSWASATVSLDWNGNTNNMVGNASEATLTAGPGGTLSLTLNLVSTSERTDTVDYWLAALTSLGGNTSAFSIQSRSLTTSDYGNSPSSSDAAVAASTDTKNNTTNASGADGVPDNQLNPRNGFDLGAGTVNAGSPGGDLGPGTYEVARYVLSISPTAALGTYFIRSFAYNPPVGGWADATAGTGETAFNNHAEIRVVLVPEPATLSLLGLGGLATFGLTFLRARRRLG